MRRASLFLLALACTACQAADHQPPVWFVHVTDPHLFDRSEDEKPKNMTEDEKRADEKRRKLQEDLSQKAFADLLRTAGALPGTDAKPAFLVVTGDFGVDGVVGKPPTTEQEKVLAKLLAASPVRDVYYVPGNNDVPGESEQPDVVGATRNFFGRVDSLLGGRVALHDLTDCYYLPGTSCEANIGTEFRLIGFPTHSFKNDKGRYEKNHKDQEAHSAKLAVLVKQAAADGRKALILTHIPELDDPYWQAQDRFAGKQPPQPRPVFQPPWSAWNVSQKVYQDWKDVVDSRAVAGVLAGHFHDNHREIYYPPYQWSQAAGNRADPAKLLLAPPLGVRLQDISPRQARGFALVRLEGDRVSRRMYWYHPARGMFQPDPVRVRPPRPPGGGGWPGLAATARMYWQMATQPVDLARAAVIAIAFLAAFLTIVELWEIPPPKTPLAPGAAQPAAATPPARDFSAFQSNFVKTVLAGLGGMLVLSFLESIWADKGINAKAYYIVLFITFFFLMLLLYALIQGLIEGLRSRIFTQHPVRAWRPAAPRGRSGGSAPPGPGAGPGPGASPGPTAPRGSSKGAREARFRLSYWRLRTWDWILSLRAFFLIFFDTFSNVLRGRNQLRTVVFEKAITDLHWSIVRAADRIRGEIERAILNTEQLKGTAGDEDIRVSVSMLSEDESVLFYIAREQGSLAKSFDKRSVAWVSIYTDTALWWEKDYPPDTELLDNTSGGYPLLPAEKILLGAYYQNRVGQDYEAFLVLPVPWAKRAATDTYRKAGIQISFRSKKMMDALFRLPEAGDKPVYAGWTSLLDNREPNPECPWLQDDQLRNVLRHSLLLLEDLLTPFNETVFDMYVRPNLRPR